MSQRKSESWLRRRWWLIPLLFVVILAIGFLLYSLDYYHADEAARHSMLSDELVLVQETEYGWFFDGPSEDKALIFYPGAKVEETAYSPLLHQLAAQGMDACLIRTPLHFAFLNPYAAGEVLNKHDYREWYIGGHSLGGVVAARYAAEHGKEFAGTILFASYPIKKLPDSQKEILLVGSEDRVINWNRIQRGLDFAPNQYFEHIIEGGNHAQFGSYGAQSGDGTATISPEDQVQESVSFILDSLNQAKEEITDDDPR